MGLLRVCTFRDRHRHVNLSLTGLIGEKPLHLSPVISSVLLALLFVRRVLPGLMATISTSQAGQSSVGARIIRISFEGTFITFIVYLCRDHAGIL